MFQHVGADHRVKWACREFVVALNRGVVQRDGDAPVIGLANLMALGATTAVIKKRL